MPIKDTAFHRVMFKYHAERWRYYEQRKVRLVGNFFRDDAIAEWMAPLLAHHYTQFKYHVNRLER